MRHLVGGILFPGAICIVPKLNLREPASKWQANLESLEPREGARRDIDVLRKSQSRLLGRLGNKGRESRSRAALLACPVSIGPVSIGPDNTITGKQLMFVCWSIINDCRGGGEGYVRSTRDDRTALYVAAAAAKLALLLTGCVHV